MPNAQTIYQYDIKSSYHDTDRCKCVRHCGNCFIDLDNMGMNSRARYCSNYCKNRMAREREFDRYMSSL